MKEIIDSFMPGLMGTELIYSFVIIVCSLMVYFGTRELYELSSHKGIKYFRQAFLFFAIAYFIRSFLRFIIISLNPERMDVSPFIFGQLTMVLFIYFSSMAVFYLFQSVIWKKTENKTSKGYLFHILAIILASLGFILRGPGFVIIPNAVVFVFMLATTIILYRENKSGKKKNNLYVIYLLLFIFFLLNVIDTMLPRFLEAVRMILYIFSIGIFLIILYKVLKKSGN